MTVDLMQFMGPMLVLAGVVLQFVVRQFKVMGESLYWLVVVLLCASVYLLVNAHPLEGGVRYAIISFLLWMVGASATVRGGSSGTDAVAKEVAKQNPAVLPSVFVPVTNSQG